MQFLGLGQGLVDGGGDQVFEHFAVGALDQSGVDRQSQHLSQAVDFDFDQVGPGAADGPLLLQFFLQGLQPAPHLLSLLEH